MTATDDTTPSGFAARERYKRPFDLAVLGFLLLAFGPLWLLLWAVIALAIRLEDGGRMFYRQPRLGRGGAVFSILKFRTMVEGAEDGPGPVLTSARDRRITRTGRVLRRFHLDELPQAVNILKGEMSLVGPRPERPELAAAIEHAVPGFAGQAAGPAGRRGPGPGGGGLHLGPPAQAALRQSLYRPNESLSRSQALPAMRGQGPAVPGQGIGGDLPADPEQPALNYPGMQSAVPDSRRVSWQRRCRPGCTATVYTLGPGLRVPVERLVCTISLRSEAPPAPSPRSPPPRRVRPPSLPSVSAP